MQMACKFDRFFPANVRLCISSLFLFVWKCAVNARHSNAIIKFSTRQITGRSTISGIGWFAMQISCKFLQIQKSAPFKFLFLTKIELNLNEQCDAAPPPLSELLLILLSGVEPLFRSLNPRPWASKCSSTNQIISERDLLFFLSSDLGGSETNKSTRRRQFGCFGPWTEPPSNEWIGSWSWKPTILDFYFN